jgi:TonB family protein
MRPLVRYRFAVKLLSFAVLALFVTHSRAQSGAESPRKVIVRVAPQYPQLARTMNLRGTVKVEAMVLPNGTVKSVNLRGGHPLLAQAAQSAVLKWRWEVTSHESSELIEIKFDQ